MDLILIVNFISSYYHNSTSRNIKNTKLPTQQMGKHVVCGVRDFIQWEVFPLLPCGQCPTVMLILSNRAMWIFQIIFCISHQSTWSSESQTVLNMSPFDSFPRTSLYLGFTKMRHKIKTLVLLEHPCTKEFLDWHIP